MHAPLVEVAALAVAVLVIFAFVLPAAAWLFF